METLTDFEYFSVVAKTKNLTQAAAMLGLSKAALSKRIRQLETQYAVNLFERRKQRLHLTAFGEALLQQTDRLCEVMQATRDLCRQFHGQVEGKLHVVAFRYFAVRIIVPRITEFLALYPKLNLQLDTTEKVPDFFAEDADLAVGFSLPVAHPDKVVQASMMTTRYVLCATPDYFARYGIPQQLHQLQQHTFIDHSSRRQQHYSLKLEKPHHCVITPRLVVNNIELMIDCAKQHFGLIQAPLYMLEAELKNGELFEVFPDLQQKNAHVYYHYPKQRFVDPAVRAFLDFFIQRSR